MPKVTERDIRMPEFRDADLEDLEFRADGKIVRKDRWETAIHRIRTVLDDSRRNFKVEDVVQAVRALVASMPDRPEDAYMSRVGKKAAGRLLDGQLYDAYPEKLA